MRWCGILFAPWHMKQFIFANYSSSNVPGENFIMQTDKKQKYEQQPVILFADDDAICLEVGLKILQKLGYKALGARDGKEAIEIFLNNQREVKLVILDMKMPYNGCTAFLRLKKINASVKVLIASGYAKDEQIRELIELGCNGFILKPFSINELSRKISGILNE
jgi:two-component system cell cycle sensor histidine kinase/response regulator CckA